MWILEHVLSYMSSVLLISGKQDPNTAQCSRVNFLAWLNSNYDREVTDLIMALKSSSWPQVPRRKSIQAIANASKAQYVIDRMNKLVSYRCQLFAPKPSLTSSSHQLIFQYYIYNVKLLAVMWTPKVLMLKDASLTAKWSTSVLFVR